MSLSELQIEIPPGDLAQIVESVFETMMNLEAFRSPAPWFADEERVTASVQLSGDWTGSLTVECGRWQLARLAGRFLSLEPEAVAGDVALDVLGELANMIGGNLKSMLSPGIQISMPNVSHGSGTAPPDSLQLAFETVAGVFWVTAANYEP
jgi:chemotaxis protein CheX